MTFRPLDLNPVWWPALIGSLLFVLLATLLIPYPGVQEDEVIFGPAIYHPGLVAQTTIRGHGIPVMLMSYLGATKSWIYALIFKVWKPSAFSIRIPSVVIYALTIWVFYGLLRMMHGSRAGAVGALLLASDPVYVLTGTFGWCNLQNVFMLGTLAAFLKFHRTKNRLWLVFAMFCTGLWLWDKAVALWMIGGLVLATAAIFWRETLKHINRANIGIGVAAFCVGAFPLILYNVKHHFPTFRSNAHFSTAAFEHKVVILKNTANGSAWLGYLVNDPGAFNPRVPETLVEKASGVLHQHVGEYLGDFLLYAFEGSFVLLIVLAMRRRYAAVRLLLFSLIVMSVAWLQMAFTENAGGGAHHPALMWPFPHLFVAVALAEASFQWKTTGRWLLVAVVSILMASNMLLVNQYLYRLIRFGGAGSWSDAIYALSRQMGEVQTDKIFVADWGIFNALSTLSQGRLPLQSEIGAFDSDSPPVFSELEAREAFLQDHSIWITHTAGNESFVGANARLQKMVAAAGYKTVALSEVRDRNGRPTFAVFRIVRG